MFVATGHGWLGLTDPNREGGEPRVEGRNEAGNREFGRALENG